DRVIEWEGNEAEQPEESSGLTASSAPGERVAAAEQQKRDDGIRRTHCTTFVARNPVVSQADYAAAIAHGNVDVGRLCSPKRVFHDKASDVSALGRWPEGWIGLIGCFPHRIASHVPEECVRRCPARRRGIAAECCVLGCR